MDVIGLQVTALEHHVCKSVQCAAEVRISIRNSQPYQRTDVLDSYEPVAKTVEYLNSRLYGLTNGLCVEFVVHMMLIKGYKFGPLTRSWHREVTELKRRSRGSHLCNKVNLSEGGDRSLSRERMH